MKTDPRSTGKKCGKVRAHRGPREEDATALEEKLDAMLEASKTRMTTVPDGLDPEIKTREIVFDA